MIGVIRWRGTEIAVCQSCARKIDAIVYPEPPPSVAPPCDCGGTLAHESYCSSQVNRGP